MINENKRELLLEKRIARLEKLVKESCCNEEVSDLLDSFSAKYGIDVDDLSDSDMNALTTIADYYSAQNLPLNGQLSWMKRDWDKYEKTGTCRPIQLAASRNRPAPARNNKRDWDMENPAYRGPRGNWSLD